MDFLVNLYKSTYIGATVNIDRRMQSLDQLLILERPTSKAIPYSEWPSQPPINFE